MKEAIKKLRLSMEKKGIDASLITQSENIRYYSGFTGSSAIVLVLASEKYLITDFRYVEQAQAQCPGFKVIDAAGIKGFDFVFDRCKEFEAKSLWFEESTISYMYYSRLVERAATISLLADGNEISKQRLIKSEDEISNIKKAAQLADKGFTHLLGIIKTGMTEREIALELEFFLRRNGSEGLAFPIIAASGPNSALPHAEPSDRKLEQGDFLTLDFGCRIGGYCSDMTRTIAIGEPCEKLREIYEITLEAQKKALGILRPGISCKQVDKVARDHINSNGYGENFGHGLGHGVGLHVHEEPRLSPIGEGELQAGMIVTVEPGIYLPKLGGVRIEDLVAITSDGYSNLVTSIKDLVII